MEIQQKKIDNRRLGEQVRQHTEQVIKLRHKPHHTSHDSEQLVATLQQSLEQKNEVIRSKERVLQEKKKQIKQLQKSRSDKRECSTAAQAIRLSCYNGKVDPIKAPLKTFEVSSVVDGGVLLTSTAGGRER